jgi:enamine deaminase RidA (YjgF/YER057c/UK114 family)
MNTIHEIPDISSVKAPTTPYSHVVRAGEVLMSQASPALITTQVNLQGMILNLKHARHFKIYLYCLKRPAAAMSKVVKTTVWLCDANNFAKLNELYTQILSKQSTG